MTVIDKNHMKNDCYEYEGVAFLYKTCSVVLFFKNDLCIYSMTNV